MPPVHLNAKVTLGLSIDLGRNRPPANACVEHNTSQERLASFRRSVKWWSCFLVTTMSTTEKIPKSMMEKFSAITAHTDAFCKKHLHDEYRVVIHRVIGALARKRPSPLLRGEENVWAAAAVHAVGRVNFLDDPSQTPHCKPKVIYEFFGVAESTGQRKSKEIRDILKIGPMSSDWTLPSRLAANPAVWLLQVNGLIVDIRRAPIELQQLAFAKGLIPFVPDQKTRQTE